MLPRIFSVSSLLGQKNSVRAGSVPEALGQFWNGFEAGHLVGLVGFALLQLGDDAGANFKNHRLGRKSLEQFFTSATDNSCSKT
jgi:hypothetical protein